MAGDPIKQAEEMLAEGVGMSESISFGGRANVFRQQAKNTAR